MYFVEDGSKLPEEAELIQSIGTELLEFIVNILYLLAAFRYCTVFLFLATKCAIIHHQMDLAGCQRIKKKIVKLRRSALLVRERIHFYVYLFSPFFFLHTRRYAIFRD